jgi:hypothetical protein
VKRDCAARVANQKNDANLPIIFAGFPIFEICFPNYFSASEPSEITAAQGLFPFSAVARGNLRRFPNIFPISARAESETGSTHTASPATD